MAFTLRNSTRLVDSESTVENKNGFNQFSAPGPHQGQGGQNVSLSEAVDDFQNKSRARATNRLPITQKSSPLKISDTLVEGAMDMNPKFLDVGKSFRRKR